MTRYAINPDERWLIATWASGGGDLATTVTTLPRSTVLTDATELAARLSELSRWLWRAYTHPASATGDNNEPNTEGWRRAGNRAAFADVLDNLRHPNLPSSGMMPVSYIPIEETAHAAGRTLHHIDDPALTDAVLAEAAVELEAVEHAERGEFGGRARQAVQLTRADASPIQVAAAHDLLRADPFGPAQLNTDIDPTSAAVAAAHWLVAAADIAAESAGIAPEQVLHEADNIEAIPHQSPTQILEHVSGGASPRLAVLCLIEHAMAAADGEIPDIDGLLAHVEDATDKAAPFRDSQPDLLHHLMASRLTPLDIARPGPDLLEDLLTGIHACYLLHDECSPVEHDVLDPDELERDLTDDELDRARRTRIGQFLTKLRDHPLLERDDR